MVNDTEARSAVRELIKRFDLINEQRLGMAYVLAIRDPSEYARLLETADNAITAVIRPAADAEAHRSQIYAALEDPNADWPKALISMLGQGPIILTQEQVYAALGDPNADWAKTANIDWAKTLFSTLSRDKP